MSKSDGNFVTIKELWRRRSSAGANGRRGAAAASYAHYPEPIVLACGAGGGGAHPSAVPEKDSGMGLEK